MEYNIGSELLEAANLLVIGMISVFLFLSLLIVCITLMSKLVGGSETPATSVKIPNPNSSKKTTVKDDKVVAVITAAVHQHRQNQKNR